MKLSHRPTFDELKDLIREKLYIEEEQEFQVLYRGPITLNPLNFGYFYVEDDEDVQVMMEAHH